MPQNQNNRKHLVLQKYEIIFSDKYVEAMAHFKVYIIRNKISRE